MGRGRLSVIGSRQFFPFKVELYSICKSNFQITIVWMAHKQRTYSNDTIYMNAIAGKEAVFFSFLTEAAIAPRLFFLLTLKLAWEVLIIISSDTTFYFFLYN